ncbi:50S ribosomal protein L17 [Salisaeta longa]|uniref:50S ribosomal protein L17 n=1 Tax=Salisaeta longa TaxID=503170 RepID=UPI0003B47E9F
MRHRKKGNKLGRDAAHRKATLAALARALIEHKRIRTTTAKAKALRPFVEPLITRAKEDTTHNRRQVFRRLQSKESVTELFTEVGPEVAGRPGGYTRIVKLGRRSGDGAELSVIELVDYNDVKPGNTGSSSSSTRRGSGKGRREETSSEPEEAAAGA